MKPRLAVLAAVLSLVVGGSARPRDVCAFEASPTILLEAGNPHAKGGRLLQVWDVADRPVLWSRTLPVGYSVFMAKVERFVPDHGARRLLAAASPSANNAIVARFAGRWIRPANCLEMLLQQVQDRRIDTFASPTEFASFILRSPEGRRLKVYFYTVNEDGIGRATPVSDPVRQDRRAGWTVLAAVHNHNFHPGQPPLNGPLAPSGPDAQFNANFAESAGLRQAWITNGVESVHIPASAFARFDPAGP